jgi:hypothetical protein
MVTAAAESPVATIAPTSKAMARADGKCIFLMVCITQQFQTSSSGDKVNRDLIREYLPPVSLH